MLNARVPNVEPGVDTPVQITPLTHATAEYAANDGAKLYPDTILQANQQIASALGLTIDILSNPPVNITVIPADSDDGNIEYANLLASLAVMATTQGLLDSDIITVFVDAFVSNEGQLIQNSSAPGVFTLQDLFANAGLVLIAAGPTSETSLTTIQAEVTQSEMPHETPHQTPSPTLICLTRKKSNP